MKEIGSLIKTKNEIVVYRNKYITVYDDDVIFPSGDEGKYVRWKWNAPFGVAIVPVVGEQILLIHNHRYGHPSISLEIPQGFGEINLSIEENARKELMEETNCSAVSMKKILTTGGDYRSHIFLARIEENCQPNVRNKEGSEGISGFTLIPISDLNNNIFEQKGIYDSSTIIGLLHLMNQQLSR